MESAEILLEKIKKHTTTKELISVLSYGIKHSEWNLLNTKMKGKEVWEIVKEGGSVTFGNRDEKGELTLSSINKAFSKMKKRPSKGYAMDWDEYRDDYCKAFFQFAVLDDKQSKKLKEKLQPYVDEIVAGLSEEALDYLYENGHEELISYEELCKLFKDPFGFNKQLPHTMFNQLYLRYNKRGKIELMSLLSSNAIWSAKCDLNDPKSIISSAIECLNYCMKEGDIDWVDHSKVKCPADE